MSGGEKSAIVNRRIKPYSKWFKRGAIGDLCDGRSAQGRYVRRIEAELIAHCGGSPSIAQRLLINRIVKLQLQLDAFDAKLASGEWTPHDARTFAGILGAYRLALREIGMKPQPPPVPSLEEHLARLAARQRSDEAAA